MKAAPDNQKFRIVISTDYPPLDTRFPFADGVPATHRSDPDDLQSMVRFLLYANEFDIEGLIASSATVANIADKKNILDMLDLYAQIEGQLRSADPAYPTADDLRSITFEGRTGTYGKSVEHNLGEGKDSEASDAIIRIIDKDDERPVWFCFWGDCSNLAQAIWRIQQHRTPQELARFISKIRIYQIGHQDFTIDWMMDNFPDLFIIFATEKTFQGIFAVNDLAWVEQHIVNNHGVWGAAYPPAGMGCPGICEGDTPSFLYLISALRGVSQAEDPTMESWGGQFRQLPGTKHYVDAGGGITVSKWAPDFQVDFLKKLELIAE